MVCLWQSLLESMVDAAGSLCPHVMRKPNLRQDLMKACTGKMVVPRSFVKNTLLEQSGIDIINKIRWVVWYSVLNGHIQYFYFFQRFVCYVVCYGSPDCK